MSDSRTIQPGRRSGRVQVPLSKSFLHRLLIADFLAGGRMVRDDGIVGEGASDDVKATARCLAALTAGESPVRLDCGESGSTLRFMLPVAMTLANDALYFAAKSSRNGANGRFGSFWPPMASIHARERRFRCICRDA